MGRTDRFGRPGERGLEAEAVIDPRNVVVDGLRHADDGDFHPAPAGLVRDRLGTAQAAVAADDEQDVDVPGDERVDHGRRILTTPGGAEDGAAAPVDVVDGRAGHLHRLRLVGQPLVTVAETDDRVDAVMVRELQHEPADDVVQTGAQTPAGDDAHRGAPTARRTAWPAARPARTPADRRRSTLRRTAMSTVSSSSTRSVSIDVVQRLAAAAEQLGQRGVDRGLAQPFDRDVGHGDGERVLGVHATSVLASLLQPYGTRSSPTASRQYRSLAWSLPRTRSRMRPSAGNTGRSTGARVLDVGTGLAVGALAALVGLRLLPRDGHRFQIALEGARDAALATAPVLAAVAVARRRPG